MVILVVFTMEASAQQPWLKNFRTYDKNGLNVFEPVKDTTSTSNEVEVKIGSAFALQFQALDHENSNPNNIPGNELVAMGNNFNLATANLDFDVKLYNGVNLHLRTYLSSRHHPEPYVKGGYITIDKLDFIRPGFLENIMNKVTFKFGHMENNYGDAHFRRSDNALAIYNPFVENFLMDAFTTEVGAEIYYQSNGWIAMGGITNGKLNQTAVKTPTSPSFIGKIGYDKQITDDFRFRLTGSFYYTHRSANQYLYRADRAGSRYYFVTEAVGASSSAQYASGRFEPGFRNEVTSIMINPFVKYNGLEFFGLYEISSGKATAETDTRSVNHIGAELLYRFGANENFYIGGRYNTVTGEIASAGLEGTEGDVTRINLGGGWFMTKNIMVKLDYVNQKYDGYNNTNRFHGMKFSGAVLEAVISF
ncbi:MAG: hypothetical protein KF845_16350 [Cyclobacteriaceae bacterium]|nr:hypothetical protein [Cyclobacteriaceae bacterium]